MIEWEVLEEDRLPEEPPTPRRPRKPIPWKPILVVVLVLAVVTTGGVAWRLRVVEEQVRNDIEQVLLREERAIRLGVKEQAPNFADPASPLAWKGWYQSIYRASELPLPTPTLEDIVIERDYVLVIAKYEMEGYIWRNARAYRLTENEWRRTPIPPSLWEQREAHRSDFFIMEMTSVEQALLAPEPLAVVLETFRDAWSDAWPLENATPIKITFSPDETLTEPQFGTQQITLRSPLLDPNPTFSNPNACSLGIIQALAQVYSGELNASGEDEYLRVVMRQAVLEELTRTTNGLCQIVQQVRGVPPMSALGLPPIFAEYLIQVGGVEAAYPFIQGAARDLDLDAAARNATGHPFEVLRYGAEQFAVNPNATQIQAAGTVRGAINYGEIVRGIESDTLTLQIREQQGVTIEASLAGYVRSLATADFATCFREGSQVAFTWETNTRLQDIRLLSRPVAPIAAALLPPTTRLIYQRENMGTTYVYARTAERETVELFHIMESVQILPHPVTQELAFLSRDGCGWVLNEYDGTRSTLRRRAVPVAPERVIWVGNEPGVVVQGEDVWGRRYWQVYLPDDSNTTESLVPLAGGNLELSAGNRGRVLGYSLSRPGFLINDDHALHWALDTEGVAPIGGELATLPFRFADNVEFSALSFDGRWLAYTVYPTDGRSDLNVLDTFENNQLYLNTIPVEQAGGETRWSAGETPRVAVAVGDLGASQNSGMSIQLYALLANGSGYDGRVYRSDAEIDQLRWCTLDEGQLTFRETTEVGSRTLMWDGSNATTPLTDFDEADRILWCP